MIRFFLTLIIFVSFFTLHSCKEAQDIHSFANIDEIQVKHIHLDLKTDFQNQQLSGFAELTFINSAGTKRLILDTWDLNISKVILEDGSEASFHLGPEKPTFGQPLIISIKPETKKVKIYYSTSPGAEALQWLTPQQTMGKKYPQLFSQSESIFARTWIPCQDTPTQKITYSARIETDPQLLALMSATNPTEKSKDGIYNFEMKQPIPVYLLAIAIGDLEFRSLGRRCGVYAEPQLIEQAAFEFSDTEKMVSAAEELCGPYRWERYDLLVLPPSFPFGGMENPRLTFVTPTMIAGDKSLVSLVAHEIAHSWSGNLVTNAHWDDFWLNEGFTSYLELRITEKLYGADYALMLEQIAYQDLKNIINELGSDNPRTKLAYDLTGKHPEEASAVAYDKGARFLKALELAYGREKFDAFLKKYFKDFAFQTMTTEKFINYLNKNLIKKVELSTAKTVKVYDWIYNPGLPVNHPVPDSPEFRKVDDQRMKFIQGTPAKDLDTQGWTTHHWVHFIKALPGKITLEQMADLDDNFQFSTTHNCEIALIWYQQTIHKNYKPAYSEIEKFLLSIGRIRLIAPLYKALTETPEGKKFAMRVYEEAKPGYHPLTTNAIEKILNAN